MKKILKEDNKKRKKISFFGHFGMGNLGNESTLQAILYHLREYLPDAEINCICTGPESAAAIHKIVTVPMRGIAVRSRQSQNGRAAKFLRRVFIGIPRELYRWVEAFRALKGTDMLIVPGTQLLSDNLTGPMSWPNDIFRWSVIAKLRRCQLLFVSVGVGPIYHPLSRWFIKSALSLASYRSYRDNASKQYVENIGFKTNSDPVYPDLAFSLPRGMLPEHKNSNKQRHVIAVGLKDYYGQYGEQGHQERGEEIYRDYIKKLTTFVGWLVEHGFTVRLLIGDVFYDGRVKQDLRESLRTRGFKFEDGQIVDEPIGSLEQLLSQIETSDVVVSPRFHNVILALMLSKPVISLSYHEKFYSLMAGMGLPEYCQHIDDFEVDKLMEKFIKLEKDSEQLRPHIKQKAEQCRKALDAQYRFIFTDL
jgi:polysaccharide pyruvyl transferase WcaK-like protein